MPYLLLLVYCVIILLASLAGGVLPLMLRLTHTTMQFAVSFVAGVMLGVGFLHMLPHALQELNDPKWTMLWVLVGFLLMFFIQRYLAVHQHITPHEQTAAEHQCGQTDEEHHHHHEDVISVLESGQLESQPLSWGGAALGLSLHSLLNGVALAAAVEAQASQGSWAGLAIFLAIAIHKPFDSLTITTLMSAARWSRGACHVANGLFALAIPMGVILFHFGVYSGGASILGVALAASAGVFVCVAASDLLPEMQFHSHDRGYLSICLLAGVGVALAVEYFG